MKRRSRGRRMLLAIHRWLGIVSAVFLAVLSLTGLALNHAEFLNLDRIQIHNRIILKQYGMASELSLSSFRIDGNDTVTFLSGYLFYNHDQIGQGLEPEGFWSNKELCVIVSREELFLLTREGDLIEKLGPEELPNVPVEGIGKLTSGQVVLVTDSGLWQPDDQWVTFTETEGAYSILKTQPVVLPDDKARMLLDGFRGEGVSLYRVLLDLHSGRLLGSGGRLVMDLAALAILVLITSGIASWRRRSGRS